MITKVEQDIMQDWLIKEPPVVSICCSTYNHGNFISEAIDGFLIQKTNFPFEIIIRDDCSTDKTSEIIRSYVEKYPNLIKAIFETENQFSKGVKSMPEVYKKASGKYCALCEGDDYWTDPLKLQKQVEFLENNLDYVITYASVEAFNENGKIENYVGGSTWDLDALELQKGSAINTPTVCFRNLIKEFPPEIQQAKLVDLFVWSLLGAYGKGKYLGNIMPTRYRVHDGGIFSKKTLKERLLMTYVTYSALYSYYQRINNYSMSNYYDSHVSCCFQWFYFKRLADPVLSRVLIIVYRVLSVLKLRKFVSYIYRNYFK